MSEAKPKNPNTSTRKKTKKNGRSKRFAMLEKMGYYGPQTGCNREAAIEMCNDALKWALEELDKPHTRRLSIRKYFLLQGLHPQTPEKEWYKKWPETRAICEQANQIIGTIREEGMLKGELAAQQTAYTLHQFLPEYRKADEYQDERKKEVNKSTPVSSDQHKLIIEHV